MLPTATTDSKLKVALNSIEKPYIYLCAFCGAANHVPHNIFENYDSSKDSLPLRDLTNEHTRCGMCAGDLKYSILPCEYAHIIDSVEKLI